MLEPARLGESASAQLIVTIETAGVMPGGLCLGTAEFRRVRDALSVVGSGLVDLSAWDAGGTIVEPVDLVVGELATPAMTVHSLVTALSALSPTHTLVSPEPLRQRAPRLARDAAAGRVETGALRALVGAGPGTTPSGDDIIVGTLAGLRASGRAEEATMLAAQLLPLLGATTSAGAHYLRAAADGRFGEHVHELLAAIGVGASASRTIDIASRWGATSGIDLLVGLAATLSAARERGRLQEAA